MNDLISRQLVMKTLCERRCGDKPKGCPSGFCTESLAVDCIPSAQQWIPCSKRFPDKEKKKYWICTDTGFQCECRWTNNVYGLGESDRWEWSIFDIPQYSKVAAWMPLPEPYDGFCDKGERNEE